MQSLMNAMLENYDNALMKEKKIAKANNDENKSTIAEREATIEKLSTECKKNKSTIAEREETIEKLRTDYEELRTALSKALNKP
jgi:chromosome segregation ATPase